MKNMIMVVTMLVGLAIRASEFTITPASFGATQKKAIELNLQMWNGAIQQSGLSTGLAAILNNLNDRNFESLFQDEAAIAYANIFLFEFNNDPVINALPALSHLAYYNINSAKAFAEQMAVALIVAKQADCLKHMIKDSVTPSKDPSYLFNFYGLRGIESLQYRIDALKNNEHLSNTNHNQEVALGMILAVPFLPILSSLINSNN